MAAGEVPPVTVAAVLAEGLAHLMQAGVETPRLDAELLLAHAMGRDRTYLAAHLPDPLPRAGQAAYRDLLLRRAAREPLPYLLGAWEWLGMRFRVTPAVLIPRPETETLVEEAARRLPEAARFLDVGTGSGCVSAGLAHLLPAAEGVALEASPEAAAVAAGNLSDLGFAGRVEVRVAEFPPGARALGLFDAVVSNPPYIATAELDTLAPEVARHEPRLALDGGPDGLRLIEALACESSRLLRPGGLLALETALGQSTAACRLLEQAGAWGAPEVLPDLAGVERLVLVRRRG